MSNSKIEFGTDGWRGLLDSQINESTVAVVAQAFADYLNGKNERNSVAVGYDGRRKSELFAEIFSNVLSGNNIRVLLSDKIVPTPSVSFFTRYKNLSAGVMITASHNPAQYNGIKFKADYGGPFFTEETHKVESLLYKSEIKSNTLNVEKTDLLPIYIEQLKKLIDFEKIRKSCINVLIDSMSGSGGFYLEELLKSESCSAKTIYGIPRADFSNRFAEPIEKNLVPLKEELNAGKYSVGVATDGDADRLGVLDEKGNWISAQDVIMILTDYIINKKNYNGNIVKTSSVTERLKNIIVGDERNIIDVQVGFKYICEEMVNGEIAFGAEESGGYGFANHIPERDGILSSLMIIECLAASGYKNISELVKEKRNLYGQVFYDRIDHHYNKPDRTEILPALEKSGIDSFAGFKVREVKGFKSSRGITNGLKFYLEGNARWLLIRASETEPMVRVYSEGESDQEVKNLLNAGIGIFK